MSTIAWKQFLICAVVGTLVFEQTAILATKLRPLSPYAILSSYANNPGFHTDENGFRGEINRGRTRKWAAFGRSFTLGVGLEHDDIWSTHLQRKVQKENIQIVNYSSIGRFSMLSGALKLAADRGERFEKVFISLVLEKKVYSNETGYPNYPYSNNYRSNSLFVSWDLLKKSFEGLPDSNIINILKKFFSFDIATASSSIATGQDSEYSNPADLRSPQAIEDCFTANMKKNECAEKFQIALLTKKLSAKEAFEAVYLTCQREVDRICKYPKRSTVVPKLELNNHTEYRIQIGTLIDLAKPIADEIYLVSHSIFRDPDVYRILAKNLLTSSKITFVRPGKFRVLTSESSHKLAYLVNDEIRTVAKEFADINKVKYLDFQEYIDNLETNSEELFIDYAHLSSKGHLLYGDYLFENSKAEKH